MTSPALPIDADSPALAVQRVVHFFENLQPSDVDRMDRIYTLNADFKDPFNEVHGLPAIRTVFAHMFEALEAPRFVITHQVQQGAQCFVTWDFLFSMRRFDAGKLQTIRGASHLFLSQEAGLWKVSAHRDYWDPAEELYEKIPWLKTFMRWLKNQARK
jgi:ketosteroid isomerase-like protein